MRLTPQEAPIEKLRMAFDLSQAAEELMRRNLCRRFPDASETEIEQHLIEWARRRPGAEHGDAEGRPSHRFEQEG